MGEDGLTLPTSPPSLGLVPTQPSQLDPENPVHFMTLCLLGAKRPTIWPKDPVSRRDYRPRVTDQVTAVAMAVNMVYPLLYVEKIERVYIHTSTYMYRALEDAEIKVWVMQIWNQHSMFMGGLSPKIMEDCVEMVKQYAHEREKELNKRYISITPELFWDTETASLTDSPKKPVFFKLFDTSSANHHFIKIPPFTPEQIETLKKEYQKALAYLESHDGDLPEEYNFVTLWADYNHDTYMDIMRLMASPFMKRKPFGAYMLVGLKRNGKTAVSNDFMKTLLGTNNCSSVQLSQLGDYHQNGALKWTLWNAPDEEEEKTTQYAAIFKTLADHGEVKVPEMYSKEPILIDADFMCAFPMNHHPVWTGSGAAACVERSRIIEFTHSFDEDNNPVKFSERTFTADLFSRILGPIFALATYFLDRPMVWSPTMQLQQEMLEGEMDSHTTYFSRFIAFFDGFQSTKVLYDDYKLWCMAHDLPISSFPAFKLAFGSFTSLGLRSVKMDGKVTKGYRVTQPGKIPLFSNRIYTIAGCKVGPLSLYQDPKEPLHYSIVERCEAAIEEKFGDKAEEQLRKMVLVAKANMAKPREPESVSAPPLEQSSLSLSDPGIDWSDYD